MGKLIIAAASYYNKKFYFNDLCKSMPKGVIAELSSVVKLAAESVKGIFSVGFYENGNIFFIAEGDENDLKYDEKNAKKITDNVMNENKELIKSIQIWHALYMTEQGKKLKKKLEERLG